MTAFRWSYFADVTSALSVLSLYRPGEGGGHFLWSPEITEIGRCRPRMLLSLYIVCYQGADNVIMDRASSYTLSDKATVASHLGVFSNDGLRTLLLAKKDMSKARYNTFPFTTEHVKTIRNTSINSCSKSCLVLE